MKVLVTEFFHSFALNNSELGCTSVLQHCIDTGDHPSIKQQPYRTPVVRREQVPEIKDAMEEQIVVQLSISPWTSPIVLVPRKESSLRLWVDYRRLNSVTCKDVYPLPRVEDILDALGGTQYFSSIELASGYWQVELDDNARTKIVFVTYKGLYELVQTPFGLGHVATTFQRCMQKILACLEWKSCFFILMMY